MSRRVDSVIFAPPDNPIFSCPSCDYPGASIATKVHAILNAFGEANPADVTWYYDAHAKCLFCGHTGPLNDFDIEQQEKKDA